MRSEEYSADRRDHTLNLYRKNVNSQAGEDGIVEYLCEKCGVKHKWCVEFGAWNGKHLSNTRRLIVEKKWSGVLIEGDQERFKELQANYSDRPDVSTICAFVSHESGSANSIDAILSRTQIPCDFDLLSIDIDGNDYYIWESMVSYSPSIVIIEANSSYDYFVDKINPPDTGGGSTAFALVELGRRKGYELVAHTGNCIFVRKELFPLVGLQDNALKTLFDSRFVRKPWWSYLYRRLACMLGKKEY